MHSQWAALSHSPWAATSAPLPWFPSDGPEHLCSCSYGFLGLPLPSSAPIFAPRLALARSATPFRPCYRWLGLQFAVEENISTGHGRFLHSLLNLWRPPSPDTHTVTDSFYRYSVYPSFSSSDFVPWLGYGENTPPVVTSCGFRNSPRLSRSHPRLRSILILHCLGGRCQPLGPRSNLSPLGYCSTSGFERSFGLGPLTDYFYGCFPSGFW